ncbi:hypothetical protein L6164_014714 [Bauhinia variegata]|uniref:Uncharacterized protein n=1 Tax=Bauhinia variegata TaxID=167791 RepID=A0ACB9NIF2_BAUVA|nr:hypothetical protein L6164_014714 [Bauhinia variegata]
MAEPVAADLQRYRAGYALKAEKVSTVVQPSLIDYAKERGVDLIQIDLNKPLTEQGPFNCIIHKVYTQEWKKMLAELTAKHPDVAILDPPELIEPLHSRVSMLNVVTLLEIPLEKETVGIPKQVVLEESSQDDDRDQALDLKFPLIAKPLLANGNLGSHELCLVFDHDGLKTLSKPLVLQEFVNHGGVIFKVYVAGQRVTCVKRKSLPDVPEDKLGTLKGTLPFSLISSIIVQENSHHDGISEEERNVEKAEMPSEILTEELARALREATGLNLFNVDVIRDANDSRRYLVVDINYCPGYAKLPSYESFFTDFLLDLASK